jgi:two-component system, OmpR family, alkaline phosphatase synthesis response regulator PhoP
MEWQVSKLVRPATGKSILVVEDEEPVRTLLYHVLASAGYAVDTVATAAAALEHMEQRLYHLVLTDDRLPDGRGVAIADRAAARGMKAVIVTGYALNMAKDEVARHEHMLKPVTPRELVSAVERHIGSDAASESIPDEKASQ